MSLTRPLSEVPLYWFGHKWFGCRFFSILVAVYSIQTSGLLFRVFLLGSNATHSSIVLRENGMCCCTLCYLQQQRTWLLLGTDKNCTK